MNPTRPAAVLVPVALIVASALVGATAIGCGSDGGADAAFARYLQADALASDPSTRIEFGRGRLPSDFPAGLPVPYHASLLGWQRTTTNATRSWEAVYEAPGDASRIVDKSIAGLKDAGWQVTDRSTQHGFESLNLDGQGKNAGRTAVVAIGPSARAGWALQLEEIGEDRK